MGIGLPAFNVPYLPMIEPLVRAIVDQDSFALIEVARPDWMKFEARSLAAVREEYVRWGDDGYVRLHLDHVPVIDEDHQKVDYLALIREALSLGYHSVMVDGSRLSLEDNIAATRAVCEVAHPKGVPVEAELGAVLGHEAGPLPPYEELFASGKGFTRPDEARRFVKESGCDWLSVAIGNVHGAIGEVTRSQKKVEARLALDHLAKLSAATGVPLVLHGGSGIKRDNVLAAMKKGIAKINVGTDIRQVFEKALQEKPDIRAAQEALYQRTAYLIKDWYGLSGIRKRLLA